MPSHREDPPAILPLPPREADVTLLQHGTLPPQARVPSDVEPELPDHPPPRALPMVADLARQNPEPMSVERQPLVPVFGPNTNSTLAGQHGTIAPKGLLPPVHAPDHPIRLPVSGKKESSDVIQTFEAGPDDAHPGVPHPAAPQKTIPPGSGVAFPPPGKILRHGPPVPAHMQPARPLPPTAPRSTLAAHSPPLETEHVVALVLEHRRRLKGLDTWTRVLEVAAVLAGVGALLGVGMGALPSAGGLALAAVALAAQATTLRHVAHTSAQVAALLDALTGGRAPPR